MKKDVATEEARAVSAPSRENRARLVAPAELAALLEDTDAPVIEPGEVDAGAARPDGDSAAAEVAGSSLVATEARLRRLAEHGDPEVRAQVTGWLPAALEWMSQLERIELVAGWAMAASPHVRLVLAQALQAAPATVGLHSALEALAVDPDPRVRLAVAEAAWVRRFEAPARLMRLLDLLAHDRDDATRSVARHALGIA